MKNTPFFLLFIIALAIGSSPWVSKAAEVASAETTGSNAPPSKDEVIPDDVIARVNGHPIPYEWFLHTFRSSFFQFGEDPAVRQQVYRQFMGQMLLHRAAVEAGVADDPAVRAQIDKQIAQSRAFMEYQLAMMEVGIICEAYLAKQGQAPADMYVSDEETQAFLAKAAQSNPQIGRSFSELPAGRQKEVRQMVRMEKYNRHVQAVIQRLWAEMKVESNDAAINAVPFPEIIRE